MNRLYAVESRFSLTGGMADHRLRLPASAVADYTAALARAVLGGSGPMPSLVRALRASGLGTNSPAAPGPWIDEVAADLKAHAGRCVILAGRRQPPVVHALVHAMNAALGNIGKTIELRAAAPAAGAGTLAELAEAIGRGQVETLVILGGNPAYNAPADLDFAALLKRVKTTIRLGLHADETSSAATWHLPAAHYLESWGDARTSDGTIVPVQPLIEPLAGGRTALEVIARLSAYETTVPQEIVRRAFRKASGVAEANADAAWRRFLHDGRLAGSARPVLKPALRPDAIAAAVASAPAPAGPLSAGRLELILDADAKVDDGRFANNGWLQELPEPVTKLTWDNAATLSPETARRWASRAATWCGWSSMAAAWRSPPRSCPAMPISRSRCRWAMAGPRPAAWAARSASTPTSSARRRRRTSPSA